MALFIGSLVIETCVDCPGISADPGTKKKSCQFGLFAGRKEYPDHIPPGCPLTPANDAEKERIDGHSRYCNGCLAKEVMPHPEGNWCHFWKEPRYRCEHKKKYAGYK